MKLTENFYLEEFLVSETAARRGIDNTPNQEQLSNLFRLATVLQEIRGWLGNRVITITSGFRSPALNAAIKGSDKSAHMNGLAADLVCRSYGSPLRVAEAIYDSGVQFDQLINEYGRWVHLGLAQEGRPSRIQLLTAKHSNGRTIWLPGLQEARQ